MERAETQKHKLKMKEDLDSRENRLYMFKIQRLKYAKLIFADVHNYLFIYNTSQISISSTYVNKAFRKSKR